MTVERRDRAGVLSRYDFELDRFQLEALDAIDDDQHVVVAAPTGSGKTLIAEYAIELARGAGRRSFYTAPIKALSNQKYRDLADIYGGEAVGLMTGDNVINPDAPTVVMTTEVLRNMIYARSAALADLGVVVLDEVHYLQDSYRGPVWEEVMIHAPPHVRLVCLSATISNAGELAEWITTVRGPTTSVVETTRPVRLTSHYLVGDHTNERLHLMAIFADGQANASAARLDRSRRGPAGRRGGGRQAPSNRRRLYTPSWTETLGLLEARDMLPAIYFIFSRNQCDEAARSVVAAGLRFTTADDRRRIDEIVAAQLGHLERTDLDVLDFGAFVGQLRAGVAAHHAGMVPPFKEVVERCFNEGLVRVVFATETLAVGINMPARTVVIEKLTKYTGQGHELLTPGDFTQLTGRAGRRGIDEEGQAVVAWSPFVRFEQVAELAASRSFHLRSVFRPTYNMVTNLVRGRRPAEVRHLVSLSFAQYQADGDVVRIQARIDRKRRRHTELVDEAESPHGDIWAYRAARDRSRSAGDVDAALGELEPGQVIWIEHGKYAGPAAIVATARRSKGMKVSVVTAQATLTHLTASNFTSAPEPAASIGLPAEYAPDRPSFRRQVAHRLRALGLRRPPRGKRRRADGVDGIDPIEMDPRLQHRVRAAGQAERIRSEIRELDERLGERTSSLALEFDRVLDVLQRHGYLTVTADADDTGESTAEDDGATWNLTDDGVVLAQLFHENELLVCEAMRAGHLHGLGAVDLAALASVFVYEHRGPIEAPRPWFPSADMRRRWRRIEAVSDRLAADEEGAGLAVHRPADPTFVPIAHAWAAGHSFADIVAEEPDVTGGDFVRTMKQLVDLLRQLGEIAPDTELREAAREAVVLVRRDVVADTALPTDPPGDGR